MHEAFTHKNRVEFVLNRPRNSFTAFTQGDARSCSIKSGLPTQWRYKPFHGFGEYRQWWIGCSFEVQVCSYLFELQRKLYFFAHTTILQNLSYIFEG